MHKVAEITGRSLAVGAVLAFLLNLACPYSVLVLHNAGLTSDYITAGAMMIFFVLVGLVNPLVKRFHWPSALRQGELIVIYVMMIVASAIPTWGLVTNLMHILTRPFYYATPENRWAELIQPLIPTWLAPHEDEVARFFYEGLPAGQSIPWAHWVIPLLTWGSAMLAVYLIMITTVVILRRPWVDEERLIFPLTQLPLEMLRGQDEQIWPALFRHPMMWLGFSIPFVIQLTRGLHHYFFVIPEIRTLLDPIFLFRNSVRLIVFVNFAIVGLAYFLNLRVAFSIWFFHLVGRCQTGLFNVAGIQLKGHNESLTGSSIALSHQGMGAMMVLVTAIVWTARAHLREVFLSMWAGARKMDDASEAMSYRAAAWVWCISVVYLFAWFIAAGLPPLATVVFLTGAFIIFLAITRVIAQGGVGFTASTMLPQPFVVYTLGTGSLGWKGLAGVSTSYAWAAEMRTSVMASAANGVRLAHTAHVGGRRLFWAMLLAVSAGLVGASWITLYLNYTYGGINLRQFGVPSIAYGFLQDKLLNPIGWDFIQPRLIFTAVGGGLMAMLIHLQHRYVWWPVHYIGLPVGDSWVMGWAWFSVFLGWLLKVLIFKFSGMSGYLKCKPLFLGFVAGQLMGGALWMVVDFALGETGNFVYIGVP